MWKLKSRFRFYILQNKHLTPKKGINKYPQLSGKYFGEPTVELITILCWEKANVQSEGSLGNSVKDHQPGSLLSFIVLDKIQLLRVIFHKLISKT